MRNSKELVRKKGSTNSSCSYRTILSSHLRDTKSYQENPKLYGYVLDLQRFEIILKENIEKGYIIVDEKELIGTENIIFEI